MKIKDVWQQDGHGYNMFSVWRKLQMLGKEVRGMNQEIEFP